MSLMELIDAYAEARHVGGCHTYNEKTLAARKAVEQALKVTAGQQIGWFYDFKVEGKLATDWFTKDYAEAHDEKAGCHNIRPAYVGLNEAAPQAAPITDLSGAQRRAFIRGWDQRGAAHELKGSTETDAHMKALMDVFYPRSAAAPQAAAAQEPYGYVFTEQYAPVVGDERKANREVFTRNKPPCAHVALYTNAQGDK